MIDMDAYANVRLSCEHESILVVTLNRPKAMNALNTPLLRELAELTEAVAADPQYAAMIVTGGERVFAAGADLKEMAETDMIGILHDVRPGLWQRIAAFSKPLIAAVNGFAFGAGNELVMHADIVIAGSNAKFGQLEINLGIIPGAGGTQRLIRAVGKSLAMQMVLSGEIIDAHKAERAGLVSEVTEPEMTLERAIDVAKAIASKSPLAVAQAKSVLLSAFETDLSTGLNIERKAFTILAGSDDRNEGIAAFIEKRKPVFKGK